MIDKNFNGVHMDSEDISKPIEFEPPPQKNLEEKRWLSRMLNRSKANTFDSREANLPHTWPALLAPDIL